jgi:cyclohexyl-isocyanide hydratase
MTEIGFLLYPRLTQLDLTGPWEVLTRGPDARCHLIWKTTDLLHADSGLPLAPTCTFEDAPDLDVLVVPGGSAGTRAVMADEAVLAWLRGQGRTARYVASVCTGALILGAAGLLDGYRATTHWSSLHELEPFGAIATPGRVVRDRNRFTGGGVTAGIDFGLTLAAELWGETLAQAIQLGIEYAPAPPFDAGTPETAPPEVVALVEAYFEANAS